MERQFGKMQYSGLTTSEYLVSENAAISVIQIILMRYRTVICSHNNNLYTVNINSNACLRTVLKQVHTILLSIKRHRAEHNTIYFIFSSGSPQTPLS